MAEGKLRVDNPANKPMHYGNDYIVGVIVPPDSFPKTQLYSYTEGQKMYSQMSNDLYENSKKAKPQKKKTPLIVKMLAGLAALALSIKGVTKLFHILRNK